MSACASRSMRNPRHAPTPSATADMKASGLAERLADTQAQLQEQRTHAVALEDDKRRLQSDAAASGKEARDSAAYLGKLEGLVAALQQQLAALQQPVDEQSPKTGDKPGDKRKKPSPIKGMPR